MPLSEQVWTSIKHYQKHYQDRHSKKDQTQHHLSSIHFVLVLFFNINKKKITNINHGIDEIYDQILIFRQVRFSN